MQLNSKKNKFKNRIKTPILITGSTGFIGANLTRKLVNLGYKIVIIVRPNSNLWRIEDLKKNLSIYKADLCDHNKIKKIILKIKPQTIFHLATYGAYSFQNEKEIIKSINLDASMNLLDSCQNFKFNSFINVGSNSEYGFKDTPMKEDDILNPNSYYAVFKSAFTNYCKFISISKKLPIVTLRPFHVYGPYEEKTRLIPVLINNLLKNKSPKLVDPNISRDMIYINDVLNLFIKVSSSKFGFGEIYNVGSGKSYKIKEIYSKISGILNSNIKPKWNSMKNRSWDQKIWVSNIKKAKKKFNWKIEYNLTKGLKETINWYIE